LYLYLNILPDIKNKNSAHSYIRKLTKIVWVLYRPEQSVHIRIKKIDQMS
jgi:hypothetical protein